MNDKVKITLVSGKGGDGAIAFRHEKCIENGGPYGGNGGKGGSISFVADNGIDTLSQYRFGKTFKAEEGGNGRSKLQYGKDGKDIILHVPCGTVVEDENGNRLADLLKHGDTYLAVEGGRGGRGNARFKSPKRRTPNIAENGRPGVTKSVYLELKRIADVGLVGYPNVGKSTFLSSVTRANAEIGDYAFTTLEPQLGVCFLDVDHSFVIADLPGLIQGASEGKGLGFTFLRHIERCRVLLHRVDLTTEEDPYQDFVQINKELETYSPKLRKRKRIVALNKADEDIPDEKIEDFKKKIGPDYEVFLISAKEKKGLKPLLKRLYKLVQEAKEEEKNNKPEAEDTGEKVYSAKNMDNGRIPLYQVVKRNDGYFEILGDRVVKTKRLINLKTDEGVERLLNYLERIGIEDALDKAGVKDGDTVRLDGYEFDYFR